MSRRINRRKFLKNSLAASAGIVTALSFEERALLAATTGPGGQKTPTAETAQGAVEGLQKGKIGNLTISRLICGGNLISGYAHSRNLIYVSSVLKHYFTDDKVVETLRIAEENGINTAILRLDDDTIRILNRYRKEGGKLQWIAQIKPTPLDLTSDAKKAIDNGAVGAFSHGGVGNSFFADGHIGLLGKMVEFIKDKKVIAGIGGHSLDVIMAAEEEGLEPDFYFKTLNTVGYESKTPKETIAFMEKVKRPWIAFKVLGAGAVRPKDGFKYAFENGAAVGMFDFKIKEDVVIAKDTVAAAKDRKRPWLA
jgi:hypothetical protein